MQLQLQLQTYLSCMEVQRAKAEREERIKRGPSTRSIRPCPHLFAIEPKKDGERNPNHDRELFEVKAQVSSMIISLVYRFT